jgi:molybdate transport system substrate-binding protein
VKDFRTSIAALFLWISAAFFSTTVMAGVPLIAAAASIRPALEEISTRYNEVTGESVRLVFGSSGTLANQIANGAPYVLFLSANTAYVRWLAGLGLTQGPPVTYAEGVLALYSRSGLLGETENPLMALDSALQHGVVKRLVIANPEYAPYGSAARAALEHAGSWTRARPVLLLGANAGQAVQYALQGDVDVALVPLPLARLAKLQETGQLQVLPKETFPSVELHQQMVLLPGADQKTHEFFAYLQSIDSQEIFRRHGLLVPSPVNLTLQP